MVKKFSKSKSIKFGRDVAKVRFKALGISTSKRSLKSIPVKRGSLISMSAAILKSTTSKGTFKSPKAKKEFIKNFKPPKL